MNKKPTNNIDDIFRDSIENMETQPSENFWLKASEDALFKSSQANRKVITQWKMIAAVLLLALISLSAYVIYMQKEIGVLNNKTTALNAEMVPAVAVQSNSTEQNKPAQQNIVAAKNDITPGSDVKESTVNNNIVAVNANRGGLKANAKRQSKYYVGSSNLTYQASKKPSSFVNSNTRPIISDNVPYVRNSDEQSNNAQNNIAVVSKNKDTKGIDLIKGSNIFITQTSNTEAPEMDMIAQVSLKVKKDVLSRFSISLFYEPYISDELLENDAADNTVVNNSVVSTEEEVNPFKIGARVGYEVSPRFTITTGASFYNFKVSFQPTPIYAQKFNDGTVGYKFQTSAGIVNCPYSNPKLGDAIVVNGYYTTNYVSIPVYIKYIFLKKANWNLYATGGIDFNMVAYRQVDMHWENMGWEAGNAAEGISNAANIYYTAYFAPGVSFKLFKGLSVYAEPSLQSPTTFGSRKGEGLNSAYYTGIGTGLTYQL